MGRLNLNIKSAILGLFIYICPLVSKAQQVDRQSLLSYFPKETVTLVANDDIILSGQMLGYATFCNTNNLLGSISEIVYVELVSDTKTTIFKHKLLLNEGKAYGDYFLPTTLKSGHYKLIAYTIWTLNNAEDAFYQKDIYIINPYLNASENNLKSEFGENEGFLEILRDQQFSFQKKNDLNGLKITTDSESYKKRSKVSLKLQNNLNTSNYGTYSVLVKKIDSIEVQTNNINKTPNQKSISSAHIPEMRGELIQGTVFDLKTNQPSIDQPVSLSISGEHHVYKSARTNSKGQFYFNVFESYEQEKALIQVVAENRNDFKIVLEPKLFDRYNELEFYPLKLNKNLEQYITQNSIFNQVESAYYNIKRDSLLFRAPVKSFYGKPDKVYVLDDFTRFNSVRETFVEVVQDAAIRSEKDGYQFLVYDYTYPFGSVFKNIKPLLLLDGLQIQNESLVVDFNPAEIESVSLVKGVYSLGSVTYNGIIDIKLKKSTDLNLSGTYMHYLDIPKPEIQKEYFKQDYSIEHTRTPDFRTQLLWQPNVELNSNSKNIDFYTSDVSGYYMVEINGIATDGKVIQLNETFKVTND